MLSVIAPMKQNILMLSAEYLNAVILNVIMLDAVMLSAVAPMKQNILMLSAEYLNVSLYQMSLC